jgi:serine protease Do
VSVPFSNNAAALIEDVKRSTAQVNAGARGIGSGVVWRADAQTCDVMTNAHVVAGVHAADIRVTLADGREAQARVLASDTQLDLALLRVELGGATAAQVAKPGAQRVGGLVFALGNPWGQVGVATQGIVSGAGDIGLRNGRSMRYIRSDVQLAPGNSGGPLVNADGAVIGINAMIFGGDLSVAIPSDVARDWVAEVLVTADAPLGATWVAL